MMLLEDRAVLAHDPHRPQYHFLPPSHWMNDPNGIIQWQGEYHLFYQHAPAWPASNLMHWGHAVSADLVHWRDLPVALSPTPDGPDKGGCWSGSTVDADGTPTIFYTGVGLREPGKMLPQVQCMATSVDGLRTWTKHPANPVIGELPAGLDLLSFRDPHLWREGDEWLMLVGSGIRDVGGAQLLYASDDLIHWRYLHPFVVGDRAHTGELWECPDFFPLGDRHVHLFSILRTTWYQVGRYENRRFLPDRLGNTNYGEHYYAAKTLLDDRGRRIMFGWAWEGRSKEAERAAGWAGVQALPRVVTMGADGWLRMEPVPELATLRGAGRHWAALPVPAERPHVLEGVQGNALEIRLEVDLGAATACGLAVLRSPDGAEQTVIRYDRARGELWFERERSGVDFAAEPRGVSNQPVAPTMGGPLALAPGETLRLHLFIDHSIIEVFANEGRACFTTRVYPTRADSQTVALWADGGPATVRALDVWPMGSIW